MEVVYVFLLEKAMNFNTTVSYMSVSEFVDERVEERVLVGGRLLAVAARHRTYVGEQVVGCERGGAGSVRVAGRLVACRVPAAGGGCASGAGSVCLSTAQRSCKISTRYLRNFYNAILLETELSCAVALTYIFPVVID